MLFITSAKVVGTPSTESGWAQVYEFKDPRAWLFLVVATNKIQDGIDGLSSAREIARTFHDEYFSRPEISPFDALKNATQKIPEMEIVACSFVNGVVYSSAVSGGRVIIFRNGSMASILESKVGDEIVITASGYPKNDDFILFATHSFFEKVGAEEIKSVLKETDMELIAGSLNSLARLNGENGMVGAVVLKFEDNQNIFKISENTEDKPIEQVQQTVVQPSVELKMSDILSKLVKKIPQRNIYIKPRVTDEVSSQSKKMTFSIGFILLIILMVSIVFGIRQKKVNDLKNKYQGILAVAESNVDQAIGLSSVSPEKSRELFLDSEAKLREILDLKVKDVKVTELQNKINESRGAILGEYKVEPVLFLDLSLLSSGFVGSEVSSSGGNMYIFDKTGQRIVSVALDSKKSKVVAGPDALGGAIGIASYEGTVFALTSDGIYEVGSTKTKVIEKTWAGEAFISAFSGNIYVLDKAGNAIYRYSGQSGSTFGSQQKWLSASTNPNFSGAVSWTMDGAIYVLFPNAKILKYSLGSPQNFSITGVTPQIGNIDAINASPDNQYIYLLDKAGRRVVVIDKTGKYKAQYISDQIAGVMGLVVSEAQKQIILLTGDKLLTVEIK